MRVPLALVLLLPFVAFGADNTLAPGEKKEGWILLFDGASLKNWRDPGKKNQPGTAWKAENGTLTTTVKPRIEEDLVSQKEYGDFELKFDWKVSAGGNTGVKYRIQKEVFVDNTKKQEGPGGFEGLFGREISSPRSDRKTLAPEATGFVYTIAFEFQLIDDDRHKDALKDAAHQTGALYSMIPARAKAAKPAGEWNSSLLKLKGQQFEHWINGTKVLEGSLQNPAIAAGAEKRWGKYAPEVRDILSNPKPVGSISLQHHGDPVWFKNIKIRTL